MARTRNLKPGFFKNEQLANCDPIGRILFAGLWCWADRAGRLDDRPLKIKAEILPFDNCDIEHLLEQLVKVGLIIRYQVNGSKFIEIPRFQNHQNPHPKEPETIIPGSEKRDHEPLHEGQAVKLHGSGALHEGQAVELHGSGAKIDPNECQTAHLKGGPLDPNEGQTAHVNGSIIGADGGSNYTKKHQIGPNDAESHVITRLTPCGNQGQPGLPLTTYHLLDKYPPKVTGGNRGGKSDVEGFTSFWDIWPKKVAKADAVKAWSKLNPDAELQAVILAAVRQQTKTSQWRQEEGKFIPHPATWLNGRRWEDAMNVLGIAETTEDIDRKILENRNRLLRNLNEEGATDGTANETGK
jgi:hypothetical protein